ncbi:MAG: hypothetical protein ACLP1Y_04745 [Candidatus Acidiferrales bacterium]
MRPLRITLIVSAALGADHVQAHGVAPAEFERRVLAFFATIIALKQALALSKSGVGP